MNEVNRNQMLKQFFCAYFHQDWDCEFSKHREVVAYYLKEATIDESRRLADAIADFAEKVSSDVELEATLFHEFGCYYQPSAVGEDPHVWLQEIVSQLQRFGA